MSKSKKKKSKKTLQITIPAKPIFENEYVRGGLLRWGKGQCLIIDRVGPIRRYSDVFITKIRQNRVSSVVAEKGISVLVDATPQELLRFAKQVVKDFSKYGRGQKTNCILRHFSTDLSFLVTDCIKRKAN